MRFLCSRTEQGVYSTSRLLHSGPHASSFSCLSYSVVFKPHTGSLMAGFPLLSADIMSTNPCGEVFRPVRKRVRNTFRALLCNCDCRCCSAEAEEGGRRRLVLGAAPETPDAGMVFACINLSCLSNGECCIDPVVHTPGCCFMIC